MKFPTLPLAACMAAGIAGTAAARGAGEIEISLRPEAVTRARAVTLGDVAVLRSGDLATIRKLLALPLGETPRAGDHAILQRDSLSRWIRARTGIAAQQIVWLGEAQVLVRSATRTLPARQTEDIATAALHQWLAARTTRFHATARPPADIVVPDGAVSITPRPLAQAQPTTRMVVWLDVAVDGAFLRSIPVSFDVEAYREGWVASQAIAAGAPLDERMLQPREIPLGVSPLARGSLLSGAVTARRTLQEGDVLTNVNTRKLAAVRRGDTVALLLQSGGVNLEGRAEALQEGEPGQVVRVRMTGASHAVNARVLARGRVEVMP